MEAVVYCVETAEEALRDPKFVHLPAGWERCPEETDREAVYQMGFQIVLDRVREAKQLYEEILSDFQSYGNKACLDTVARGMPEFFRRYDARFCPQDHLLTLDYPVLMPLSGRQGADRILMYLSCIRLEQRFLRALDPETVRTILSQHHDSYKELIINLCSIVLRNMLGHMMAGKRMEGGGFTRDELARIAAVVIGAPKEKLSGWIDGLLRILVKKGYEGEEKLYRYLNMDGPDFVTELQQDAENGCLERLFVW